MARYLKSNGNPGDTVVTYPYSKSQFRADYPNVSLPTTAEGAKQFNVHVVAETPPASPSDPDEFKVVEDTPALIGDTWTQTWKEVALTQEEKDQRAQSAQITGIINDLKASNWHRQFSRMSTTEVRSYVNSNVNTLEEAIQFMEEVSLIALLVAARGRDAAS